MNVKLKTTTTLVRFWVWINFPCQRLAPNRPTEMRVNPEFYQMADARLTMFNNLYLSFMSSYHYCTAFVYYFLLTLPYCVARCCRVELSRSRQDVLPAMLFYPYESPYDPGCPFLAHHPTSSPVTTSTLYVLSESPTLGCARPSLVGTTVVARAYDTPSITP